MLLYLLSPAKTLDFTSNVPELSWTMPRFLHDSAMLADVMKLVSVEGFGKMMSVSPKLAELNVQRFQDWKADYTEGESRQAILAFKGGVYQGLDVESWASEDFDEAQKSLRILSGLYGVLRPMDLMMPYRLEMGKKVMTSRGANLYQFWGSILTDSINAELSGADDALINLASNEYFSAVDKNAFRSSVITPVFKDWKNGKLKVISFYAKKARGQMAAWAIQNRLTESEELKAFSVGGYAYDDSLSSATSFVFTRAEA